jgi:hypothetical protein
MNSDKAATAQAEEDLALARKDLEFARSWALPPAAPRRATMSPVPEAATEQCSCVFSSDTHDQYLDLVIALTPLALPVYIMLWILNHLPQFARENLCVGALRDD